MTEEQVQVLKCANCGRQLGPDDYICDTCKLCQNCCMCSTETNPETTLAGD